MERRLKGHPWVEKAVLAVIEDRSPSRSFIGALIVLSRRGKENLKALGRTKASRELRDALAPSFDAVTLPRYFRFADRVPVNSQGKTARADIAGYFRQPAGRRI